MKRCKICRKSFDDENNLFQCQSCLEFYEYKKNYKVPHNPIDVSEIEYVWVAKMHYNAMSDIGKVYGTYTHSLNRIRINLFAWSDKVNIMEIYCSIVNHEYMHKFLTLDHGIETSNAYDRIAEKLEDYLGLSFRGQY